MYATEKENCTCRFSRKFLPVAGSHSLASSRSAGPGNRHFQRRSDLVCRESSRPADTCEGRAHHPGQGRDNKLYQQARFLAWQPTDGARADEIDEHVLAQQIVKIGPTAPARRTIVVLQMRGVPCYPRKTSEAGRWHGVPSSGNFGHVLRLPTPLPRTALTSRRTRSRASWLRLGWTYGHSWATLASSTDPLCRRRRSTCRWSVCQSTSAVQLRGDWRPRTLAIPTRSSGFDISLICWIGNTVPSAMPLATPCPPLASR